MHLSLLLVLSACAYANLESHFRQAEDKLYEAVCRDPTTLYIGVDMITLCPMFYRGIDAPFDLEDLAYVQVIKVKKCSSMFSYCPTLQESRCVSVPMTETPRKINIKLNNGTSTTLTYMEDSSCRCDCTSIVE